MAENDTAVSSDVNKEAALRNQKAKIGVVVSDKMAKSIVVKIERREQHPVYKKYLKKTIKILAHDEKNEARIGDKVSVVEVRPLSRLKSWSLSSIIEKVK